MLVWAGGSGGLVGCMDEREWLASVPLSEVLGRGGEGRERIHPILVF